MSAFYTNAVSIGFAGLANIYNRWLPKALTGQEDKNMPSLMIAPPGAETYPVTVVGRDNIGYPVLACFVANQAVNNTANQAAYLKWRWQLQSFFRFQRLQGVSLVYNCLIEPQSIIDEAAFGDSYWVSATLFRFITRETRGLKA